MAKSPSERAAEEEARRATREEDAALMTAVAAQEEDAVGRLYDRFGALVYRMAYQSLPSKSEAEDAVQEVFVRLWRTADRYDAEKSALVTWVMLITRRHLVDKLRRAKARIPASNLGEAAIPRVDESARGESDRMDQSERFGELMKRVESLPELQRVVVTRAYLGGQTLRQIGDELGTPLGTVKSALSRALVRLRERVD